MIEPTVVGVDIRASGSENYNRGARHIQTGRALLLACESMLGPQAHTIRLYRTMPDGTQVAARLDAVGLARVGRISIEVPDFPVSTKSITPKVIRVRYQWGPDGGVGLISSTKIIAPTETQYIGQAHIRKLLVDQIVVGQAPPQWEGAPSYDLYQQVTAYENPLNFGTNKSVWGGNRYAHIPAAGAGFEGYMHFHKPRNVSPNSWPTRFYTPIDGGGIDYTFFRSPTLYETNYRDKPSEEVVDVFLNNLGGGASPVRVEANAYWSHLQSPQYLLETYVYTGGPYSVDNYKFGLTGSPMSFTGKFSVVVELLSEYSPPESLPDGTPIPSPNTISRIEVECNSRIARGSMGGDYGYTLDNYTNTHYYADIYSLGYEGDVPIVYCVGEYLGDIVFTPGGSGAMPSVSFDAAKSRRPFYIAPSVTAYEELGPIDIDLVTSPAYRYNARLTPPGLYPTLETYRYPSSAAYTSIFPFTKPDGYPNNTSSYLTADRWPAPYYDSEPPRLP